MVRLRDAEGESVHLYVRQRDRRVCVAAVEGNYELRHFTEVGKPLPLSAGASGKLLLAFADPATQALELRAWRGHPSPRAWVGRADGSARRDPRHRLVHVIRGTRGGTGRGGGPDPEPRRSGSGCARDLWPNGRLTAERLVDLAPTDSSGGGRDQRLQGWTPSSAGRA